MGPSATDGPHADTGEIRQNTAQDEERSVCERSARTRAHGRARRPNRVATL